mgnify:CR=1 FL=1
MLLFEGGFIMEQNGNTVNQKNNKKPFILLVSILLVLVIGAVGVFAYNQFVKNPLVQYAKAEINTMEELWSYKDKYYPNARAVNEKMIKEPYESTLTLSANAELPPQIAMYDPSLGEVQSILSSLRFVLDSKINPDTNEAYGGVDFKLQGMSLLDAEVYQNEDITAAKVPLVYDKYFVFENNKLGDFLYDVGELPEPLEMKIPNFVELKKGTLTQEEQLEFAKNYLEFFAEQISDENVAVTDNVSYEGGKYQKLEIQFSESEVHDLLKAFFEKAKEDGLFNSPFFNDQGLEEEFDTILEDIESIKFPDGMTYEAYMDGDFVAYRTLTINIDDGYEEVTLVFDMNTVIKGEDEYDLLAQLTAKPASVEGEMVIKYNETGAPDGEQYLINRLADFQFKDDFEDIGFGFEGDTVYSDNTSETEFELLFNFDGMTEIPNLGGYFNTEVEDNGDEAVKNFEIGLDVDIDDPFMGNIAFSIGLNGENEITFTDKLDFPTVDETNSEYVFDLTPEDADRILYEIEENLSMLESLLSY